MNEIKTRWHMDKTFVPGTSKEQQQRYFRNWKRAVERSKKWINETEEE
jgi:glycerol kinase